MKKLLLSLVAVAAVFQFANAQIAVSTNALQWGVGAANVGIEVGVAPKWSVGVDFGSFFDGYSKFRGEGWFSTVEARYYLCEVFNGHHFGVYGMYMDLDKLHSESNLFNVFGYGKLSKIPDYLAEKYKEVKGVDLDPSEYDRTDITGFSFGISYGYYFKLSHHWGLDAYVGGGYAHFKWRDRVYDGTFNEFGKGGRNSNMMYVDTPFLSRLGVTVSYKF